MRGPHGIRLEADLLNDGRAYRGRISYLSILKQDDEFVTTDATYMTAAIRRMLYAIKQLRHDFVSGLMPEEVVDQLEAGTDPDKPAQAGQSMY